MKGLLDTEEIGFSYKYLQRGSKLFSEYLDMNGIDWKPEAEEIIDNTNCPRVYNDKPIYVIINEVTGSAAEEGVAVLKNIDNATVVGNHTSGKFSCGNCFTFFLPNSHLEIYFGTGFVLYEGKRNMDAEGGFKGDIRHMQFREVLSKEFETLHSLYKVTEVNDEIAREIVEWEYEGEYAIYNMPSWEECEKLDWAITSAQKRHNCYYAVYKTGEFLGFFRIMERNELVELGVGIKPKLCGQHNGKMLMELALEKIEEKYNSVMVQLKVRPFNTRAIKCYESAGFKIIGSYYEDKSYMPGEMIIMHKMID